MIEREMERMREREPVERDLHYENVIRKRFADEEYLANLPHVIKYDSVPFGQNIQARVKSFMGDARGPVDTWKAPFFSNSVMEQIVTPGSHSGKHRHYMEALFYIIEGHGYCVHDEKKYLWEAGDIFCVPTYCIHQRFCDPDSPPARLFFLIPSVFTTLGLTATEPIEIHPDYKPTEQTLALMGADKRLAEKLAGRTQAPKFEGEVKNLYDGFRKQFADEVEWRLTCPQIVQGAKQPWEDTAMGRIKWLLHPSLPSGLRCFIAYVQEIPPGGRSGKHLHVSEEVHKILKGRGYDMHDGVRWDWEEEDVVFIPKHTVHQHFNADPKNPALFVSILSGVYSYIGHGGIEHLEDAPK
ncbi:MAG TPA: cupin domain-containing protein [bacterium]|nr:cupin domain-containing protein [bacterium]